MRLLIAVAVLLLAAGAARAQGIDQFVGNYVGKATDIRSEDGEAGRDLSISITKGEDGRTFVIEWGTVIWKAGNRPVQQKYKITFIPSERPNVYSAAMRKDMFGKYVPLDPMKGDPYFWARVAGNTLSVFYILITDEGGYEMQVYHRTLTAPDKMRVEFKRIRDGVALRTITAELQKVK
jgi:hypothetical protein